MPPSTWFLQITVNQPNGGEVWQATVGAQGISYNMDNTPVTLNTANFYDPGGLTGNYTYTGATLTKTFTPDIPTNKLRIAFTSFSTYNGADRLGFTTDLALPHHSLVPIPDTIPRPLPPRTVQVPSPSLGTPGQATCLRVGMPSLPAWVHPRRT
ncbi:MAG: hypothetical protein U0176_13105 [Bacteroidia bacterium]